ncbi:MAG: hypothetical protein ACOYY2_10930 [Actinomycetota bacterium]
MTSEGELTLLLTDPAAPTSQIVRELEALGGPLAAAAGSGSPPRIVSARYSYSALLTWKELLTELVLGQSQAVFVDIEERRGVVRVGTLDLGQGEGLLSLAVSAGIPRNAVQIGPAQPIRPLVATLQDWVRPVVGGVQIEQGGWLCTLGFNTIDARSIRGGLTNSHCTSRQGGSENTPFYQPSNAPGTFLGNEYLDPVYFTGSSCPAGYRCRYSDAALIQYAATTSSSLGRIARPSSRTQQGVEQPLAPLVSPTSPELRILGESPYAQGTEILDKIGRTTGWTYGPVSRTCTNYRQEGTDIIVLCQDEVTGVSAPGDSGAPVFAWNGADGVQLFGVLWGGDGVRFVYSPMGQIEGELGQLGTS